MRWLPWRRSTDPGPDAPGRDASDAGADEGPDEEPDALIVGGPRPRPEDVAPEPYVFRRRGRADGAGAGLRLPILAAVVGLVALAVVVQDRRDAPARAVATETPTPIVAPSGVLASAWYCAGGGAADQTLVITNAGTTTARAVVTVMSSTEIAVPATRAVEVPAASTVRLVVSDVVTLNEPGVLVEALAGEVTVSHELTAPARPDGQPGDAAVAACASESGTSWFFAAGSTDRGAQDHVMVFNPFADDAAVDVTILTTNGSEKPGQLQAVSVPHQSRVTLKIEELALRQPVVGVAVSARRGRVVAEQVQSFDGTDGRVGLALVPGLARPSQRSSFPDAFWSPTGTETLVVANPADVSAIAMVSFSVTSGSVPVPTELRVGPGTVATLNVNELVPPDVHHSITVDAAGAAPLAAALVFTTAPRPTPVPETTAPPPTEPPTTIPATTIPATTAPAPATAPAATAPSETTATTAAPAPPPVPETTAPPEPTATTAAGAPTETTATTAPAPVETTTAPTTVPETTAPPTTVPAPTTTLSPVLPPLPNGYEILVPAPAPARVWLVPGGPPAAGTRELIGIANPGLDAVTVTINVLDGGRRFVAPGLDPVGVAAGQITVVVFDAAAADAGAAAIVSADGPVNVSRWSVAASSVTTATAIPFGP